MIFDKYKYIYNSIRLFPAVAISAIALAIAGCNGLDDFNREFGNIHSGPFYGKSIGPKGKIERTVSDYNRRVMILYSAGFNNLSNYLKNNIEDLKKGFIPGDRLSDNVLLVFSKQPVGYGEYATQTSPVLFRLYKDPSGKTVSDTLLKLPSGTLAASSETLGRVLTYIKENFPAKGYGMIVSSHATGWLPYDYYNNPSKYDPEWGNSTIFNRSLAELKESDNSPAVKSITQEYFIEGNSKISHEIDMEAFSNAIPMHLDYLLFDACLMGCVEVAYTFKDKCSFIGFSQTEVLAEGYNYNTIARHLIGSPEPDAQKVCSDYFDYYFKQTGQYQSATISYIDCSKMDNLATVCKDLFSKYRLGIANADASSVQRYFRYGRHFFYDLKDILAKSGASEDDLAKLQEALDEAVVYKGATPAFLSINIKTFSGFSMYLPSNGSTFLNNYYKTLSWNTATSLVQ